MPTENKDLRDYDRVFRSLDICQLGESYEILVLCQAPETLKAKFCPFPYVLDKSFLDPLRITKPQSVTSPLVKSARRILVIQNKELLSPMQPKVNDRAGTAEESRSLHISNCRRATMCLGCWGRGVFGLNDWVHMNEF